MGCVVARGDGGGGERARNPWDVGRGTVDDRDGSVCRLSAGVTWEGDIDGEGW